MEWKLIIGHLFKFESFEYADDTIICFYSTELVASVGDYPIGTKFEVITIDLGQNGVMEFETVSCQPVMVYGLKFNLGQPMTYDFDKDKYVVLED